jgi:DNA invertase Pin-like site-specific DNA recombinase
MPILKTSVRVNAGAMLICRIMLSAMPRKGGSKLNTPDEVKRLIIEMRNNGSTKAEIGKALGVSDHTIRRASVELKEDLKIAITLKDIQRYIHNG